MNTQIVEIQPRELKFILEVKKQSSCIVHLGNVTDQYVAFKVKTTNPKKYCVRPNVGIIKPKTTYDFTVTMQAQKSAVPEMQCKDKFLIQTTVVPFGTTEEEITPGMFSKESQKYIEETKLRVLLTSAPNSPAKPLADSVFMQEASYQNSLTKEPHYSPVLLPVNAVTKQEPAYDTSKPKDTLQNGIEIFSRPEMLINKVEAIQNVKNKEESRSLKVVENLKSVPAKNEFYSEKNDELKQVKDVEEAKLKLDIEELRSKNEFYPEKNDELKQVKDVEEAKLKLDIEELRSKINAMNIMLIKAEHTIVKLKEEKTNTIREKETLKQELATVKTNGGGGRKIQVGFPPLFVCMVALISLMLGSFFRA